MTKCNLECRLWRPFKHRKRICVPARSAGKSLIALRRKAAPSFKSILRKFYLPTGRRRLAQLSPGSCQTAEEGEAEKELLVEESRISKWGLPLWIALHMERGLKFRCFFGHKLISSYATRLSCCYRCGTQPLPPNAPMLWCRKCEFWGMCSDCVVAPRLPLVSKDPLFHGPHDPCLIQVVPAGPHISGIMRGAIIICPGGNYEFLCAHEAYPVARWLAKLGIYAYILRYRLLPAYTLADSLADLSAAARHVRGAHGADGPIGALGFSAGGHLIASLAVEEARQHASGDMLKLSFDAQVLVYAAFDSRDWQDPDLCGFWDIERCMTNVSPLLSMSSSLLGEAPGFAAPPSLVIASLHDDMCAHEAHSDRYVAALTKENIPHQYLLRDYGGHGFALDGGWCDDAAHWLFKRGFGHGVDPHKP